jgi:hypothetical protein
MENHCHEHHGHPPGNHAKDQAVERTAPLPGGETTEYTLPADEHVRLIFELSKADIYAFWYE